MPNPGGGNQFGGFQLQPKYGDVKQQTELTRAAPISGAPISGRALNTPRRGSQQARRGRPAPAQAAPPTPQSVVPQAAPDPTAVYHGIAGIDGASPLVRRIFGG